MAAQLYADWLLFGVWPTNLWRLPEHVLDELRFYVQHVTPPTDENDDEDRGFRGWFRRGRRKREFAETLVTDD